MVPRDQSQGIMSVKEELKDFHFWKAVRCEFLGSLLYAFLGCGAMVDWDPKHLDINVQSPTVDSATSSSHSYFHPAKSLTIALTFGLSTATLVQCMGHISGAHVNPAVTLSMLVTRNITPLRAIFYALGQLLGAITGIGILYGVTPNYHSQRSSLGAIAPSPHMTLGQAFGVEFMITFVVVFTIFANLEPKRSDMGSRSLAIGLAVTLVHLFAVSMYGKNIYI